MLTADTVTDEQIRAFRAELLKDAFSRDTDAPYLCLRALATARGKNQKAARAKARIQVVAAMATWVKCDRDGLRVFAYEMNRR